MLANTNLLVHYRFGFNGQEKDNEVKGIGNSLDFGARIYDSRLGKWLSLDPLQAKYPSLSPYNFVANSPIMFVDPDGRVITYANKQSKELFEATYKLASKEFKTKIDRMKSSKVEYNINTQVTSFNGGGMKNLLGRTSFDFDSKASNGRVMVEVGDNITTNNRKITTLADELTGASQFEEGKMGFLLNKDGTQGAIGYDMADEIATKKNELAVAEKIIEGTNGSLDPDIATFKKYLDEGKPAKYFRKSKYGKQYNFNSSKNTPAYGNENLTIWLGSYKEGAIEGAAFKANISKTKKDEYGSPALSPGGNNMIILPKREAKQKNK